MSKAGRACAVAFIFGLCALPAFGLEGPIEVQDVTEFIDVSTAPPVNVEEKRKIEEQKIVRRFLDASKTISQVSLFDEFLHHANGDEAHSPTARFDYTFASNFYWRMDFPYVVLHPQGESQETGFGDVFLRGVFRLKKFEQNAIRGGVDATLDTGRKGLGGGTNIIGPVLNGTIVLNRKVRLQPWVLYYHSLSEASNGDQIRNLRFKLLTKVSWSKNKKWLSEFELQARADLTGKKQDTLLLETEVARDFRHRFGIYVRPGIRITGNQAYDWKFESGITRNF